MKRFPGSNCRDVNNRTKHSKKYCCCGGHNYSNHKRNKNHNATRNRLSYKTNRRFLWDIRDYYERWYIKHYYERTIEYDPNRGIYYYSY